MKLKKILFFIDGSVPSKDERKEAKELEKKDCKVCFRNIKFIEKNACLEEADEYMGAIPKSYLCKVKKEMKAPLDLPPVHTETSKVPFVPSAPSSAPSGPSNPGAPVWTPNA